MEKNLVSKLEELMQNNKDSIIQIDSIKLHLHFK